MAKNDITPYINEVCRVSVNTELVGTMVSDSDIRIDGKFKGDIFTKGKIVLGEKSRVEGKIFCQNIDVWGAIIGDVYASDSVVLKSTVDLKGTLKTLKLGIEVGAVFNGACDIITPEEFEKLYEQNFPKSDIK